MSLTYNWWFTSPPPDLHQVFDLVDAEYAQELAVDDERWLLCYQGKADDPFYLYYNEPNALYPDEEDTLLLTINSTSTVWEGKQELPLGELDVRYAWHLVMGKGNYTKAMEVYTRLLGAVLLYYEGDMAALFQAQHLEVRRLGERLYLNQSSGLAHEPLLSLLDLSPGYEVGDYPSI